MNNDVCIFREIVDPAPALAKWLGERDQLYEVEDDRGNVHLFLDNTIPRPREITEMIVGREAGFEKGTKRRIKAITSCTKGFALFVEADDGYEGPIAVYARLENAEQAANSAKIVVKAEIEGVENSGWDSLSGASGDDSGD